MLTEQEKKTCFVIGPIGNSGSKTRIDADFLLDGIIKEVLEREPFSYNVKRADKDVSVGSINSAVINDIINADLAIADLSERNPNAFYELGIRHAFNKPVIHMIRENETIPFDNLDQRCISFSTSSWDGVISARKNLSDCVEYLSSSDYKPSNPVTLATALRAMANSGDKEGAIIASLVEKVNSLEKQFGTSLDQTPVREALNKLEAYKKYKKIMDNNYEQHGQRTLISDV
ncbi:MAG: hypothetical protein ABF443_00130 [Acetobacter malorum]|uniref:hypothetical protein n=1 Tax=Acetobacter malorum TaxID=178901 RepID=UPI0039EB8E72